MSWLRKARALSSGLGLAWQLGVVLLGTCLVSGCSGAKVEPLAEPVFRLNSPAAPANCKANPQTPCVWTLRGNIDSFDTVPSSENPFRDCQGCSFNQKFSLVDAGGTRHFLYYRLPTDEVVTLELAAGVILEYIDGSNLNQGYAMSLRRLNGSLLFAVSSGAGGEYLTGARLNPVALKVDRTAEAAREQSECGAKIFRYLVFEAGGKTARLAAGQNAILRDNSGTPYKAVNVNYFNRQGSNQCGNLAPAPFSFFVFSNPAEAD